ncbi:hypothetical protein, partial [Marinitenerispora sediminis]
VWRSTMGPAPALGPETPTTLPFQPPWDLWEVAGLAAIAWAVTTLVARAGRYGCGASLAMGAVMALMVVLALVLTPAGW